ncbi:RING-H2 finger protein ATL40-like [Typha angustifolia]|uniref:RING-H2 finger protein ATL40-like n=1 Tax=Typha angustifolia TaxID=59011 RepID=UPI003C2BEBE8
MSTNVGEQQQQPSYAMDSKVLLTAVITLLSVAIFVILLHLYALYYLRHRRRTTSITTDSTIVFHRSGTGLDREAISALPTFPYKKSSSTTSECAVCLSVLEDGEEVRLLPNCKHTFHVECIDMWLHSHPTCPICRSDAEASKVVEEAEVGDVAADMDGASNAKEVASTSRLGSSLRRMLSGDWSGRRMQPTEGAVEDLERGSSGLISS